jgi:photosystem II stability/assembly factor-like uncharacterized protein
MKLKLAGFCILLLLLLTGSAFAQWQLKYSIELSYTFNSVTFPSSLVGYIVGSGGVIYKTTDGGSTWTQQTSPTGSTLNDVSFWDTTHGWAVGAGGVMIYTTDGTNWTLLAPSPTTQTLMGVSFVGLNGVACGGSSDNVKGTILYTTDGGTTWTAATTNPSADYCTDVMLSDATHGFISCDGGNGVKPMMYTTDGGVNWTAATTVNYGAYSYTRYDLEALRAISNTTIIATGWGSSAAGAQPTIILVSTDGGVNYNAPDPLYSWQTFGYGDNIASFDDGEAVVVGGGSQTAGITIHGTGPTYTSWTRAAAFYGDEIQDACAVPGTNKIVAVGSTGLIALSTDRGSTWSFLYDGGMPFQGLQDFVSMGKDKVLAAGAGGAVLHFDLAAGVVKYGMASPNNWGPTTVGDLDYVPNPDIPPPGSPGDTLYDDVIYLSGGNRYLCKSYDGGNTWIEQSHALSLFDGLLGMYWFDPDTGFVVGHKYTGGSPNRDEVIWKTVNGGYTLTEVLAGTIPGAVARLWYAVDFAPANRNVGAVVGTYNKIRYTADGGVTWPLATENITDTTVALVDVAMINATTGFAVGDKGILVKTTNGGATWTVQTVPWGAVNLIDIEFSTPNRLWVGGKDNGFLYYSTDGGANWTNVSIGLVSTTTDVQNVFWHGAAGILWAGCENSYVASRTDNVAGTDTPNLPFALNQNYPNPFNPSTTIEFAIASDDHVSLNVYDVSGKLVARIMNKDLKAGKYTVAFKADNLATGVYFYKLTTSTFEETRKMVLIR